MSALRLRWQMDGPRYYLDDEPVHAGTLLEARRDDGSWAVVRFEYHWDRANRTVEPFLIAESDRQLLGADTKCRWPRY